MKRYVYEVDANSPFASFKAAKNLTETFRAVVLRSGGLSETNLGDIPTGILLSKQAAKGEETYIVTSGIAFWEIGEAVTAGDLLTAGNDGLAVKCVAGDYIFARALDSADSGLIHVQIVHAGFINVFFEDDEWNTLKIFFGFPISKHRRYRAVSYPNPREDLTKEEILAVGNFAVENKIIANTAGEIADKVIGAALKRKEVTRIF